MDRKSIAPCGVICDLCLGFQRDKNRCVGCNAEGEKVNHCNVCTIKYCPEKEGISERLCIACSKFPCKRIRDLEKRYATKYGESPIGNMQRVESVGIKRFLEEQEVLWRCNACGNLVCVHREVCLHCGAPRTYFIRSPITTL